MSHFLERWLGRHDACALVNERTGSLVAGTIDIAADAKSRRRGLLGRESLPDDYALVLAPCNAVHTCFMRFPIDVAFVARDGRVIKTVRQLAAWRVALAPRAFATIELAAGALRRRGVLPGDRVMLRPTEAGSSTPSS